jgi:immune inhibitor A
MASGSWGGGGNHPTHPSAWCKANQGWVSVVNRTSNGIVSIPDVKTSHTVYRLWKDGMPGKEYFLVENRQQSGAFDASMPGSGLLVWHIDENQTSNRDENHYWVALMQADGRRDMELNHNRGDAGDAFPGTSGNANFTATSTPNSKSYANAPTCVAVTGISASGPAMSANLQCQCQVAKLNKEFVKEKEFGKEGRFEKPISSEHKLINEKGVSADKRVEKPLTDKAGGREGLHGGKFSDGKFGDGKFNEAGSAQAARVAASPARRHSRRAHGPGGGDRGALGIGEVAGGTGGPFIGNELRPDLRQGALSEEGEHAELRAGMASGTPHAKRFYDTRST